MAVSRCVSSHVMTELLAWRNPQGSEQSWWIGGRQGIDNNWEHLVKVVSTEIGLLLLTVTSIVETVAYAALGLISLALYPITDRPCTFFVKLLQSSSFTIIWGVADALLYNPCFINVMTHESFARYWAQMFNPTFIKLFRLDDRLYIADWRQQHGQENVNDGMLGPILAAGHATQVQIDQGAYFLATDVLSGASPETITLFKEMDPSIFMFILTKAVYIYTAGTKKKDEIPDFFKPESKALILTLRQELNDAETLQQLQHLIANPAQFETTPQGESAKSAFTRLRGIASGELQDSLLSTRCWQKAVAFLDRG